MLKSLISGHHKKKTLINSTGERLIFKVLRSSFQIEQKQGSFIEIVFKGLSKIQIYKLNLFAKLKLKRKKYIIHEITSILYKICQNVATVICWKFEKKNVFYLRIY